MSQNILKVMLLIGMTLNHIAAIFMKPGILSNLFLFSGMICMPLYSFFLVEGYFHSKNRWNYGMRLAVFAVLSDVPYRMAFEVPFPMTSVMLTLFLSFICLCLKDSSWSLSIKAGLITAIVLLSIVGDWGVCAPLWVLAFHQFYKKKILQLISFSAIGTGYLIFLLIQTSAWYAVGIYAAIPLIAFYNGRRGWLPKWLRLAFYYYYPVHLAFLSLW